MQTVFPKIATILLAISAVAFMGLSMAAYYGRPDPVSEMLAPEIKNYHFGSQTAENTTWSMTPIVGENQTAKQFDSPYAAILEAYELEERRLGASTTEMSDLGTQLSERITIVRAQQQQDIAAIDEHIKTLAGIVARLDVKREQDSKALQDMIDATTVVRNETTKRRQDVMRLQNELEELRTDRFRLEDTRRILTDRLVRLQLENQTLDSLLKQITELVGQQAAAN